MRTTYKYERRVQILVVLFQKILIVLLGLLAVLFVEFSAKILHGWRGDFFLAERGF